MNVQTIPLNRLIPSPANVCKTGTLTGIDELAASIAAHGLLQNLQVRPAAKAATFEVIAGGPRLAALKLLAKRKTIAKDAPVACNVTEGAGAGEISLAENIVRLAMHPADQFDAFKGSPDDFGNVRHSSTPEKPELSAGYGYPKVFGCGCGNSWRR